MGALLTDCVALNGFLHILVFHFYYSEEGSVKKIPVVVDRIPLKTRCYLCLIKCGVSEFRSVGLRLGALKLLKSPLRR